MLDNSTQATIAIRDFVFYIHEKLFNCDWICLHQKKEHYNITAFSQETDIVKYYLEMKESKITAVIISEKKGTGKPDVALEVIFADKPDLIFPLPLVETDKEQLRETLPAIRCARGNKLNQDIISSLPR